MGIVPQRVWEISGNFSVCGWLPAKIEFNRNMEAIRAVMSHVSILAAVNTGFTLTVAAYLSC